MNRPLTNIASGSVLAGLILFFSPAIAPSACASTIVIVNNDAAGEGFNDPTPASPVGGNPGTTIGAQRLFIFQHAAAIWGAILPSSVTIQIRAQFNPQFCDATSAVLGSASALAAASDFPGAPLADTWYQIALANKLAGEDLSPTSEDVNATFNSDLDNSTCLGSVGWYYGTDGNDGGDIELLSTVLHEIAHGLGFATFTNSSTGQFLNNRPDAFAHFLLDKSTGEHWDQMNTNNKRKNSAVNTGNLVWDGPLVTAAAPGVLGHEPEVNVSFPPSIAGSYVAASAEFGPAVSDPGVTADVVLVEDAAAPTGDACEAIVNGPALAGRIALIDRGICNFVDKALAAQANGAVGVIVANNVAGDPVPMGGVDPSIVIPSVMISQAHGTTIKNALLSGPVTASLKEHPTRLTGAHPDGQVRMYAPNPVEPGSSVSHWDDLASPDLLMEPFIGASLGDEVDLTHQQLIDIGWLGTVSAVSTESSSPGFAVRNAPNPFHPSTVLSISLPSSGTTRVEVYDVQGRLVKRLWDGWLPSGTHAVTWDGTDGRGRAVGSGVFFSRVESNGHRSSQRMVRLDSN
jgi:hypothetical protein